MFYMICTQVVIMKHSSFINFLSENKPAKNVGILLKTDWRNQNNAEYQFTFSLATCTSIYDFCFVYSDSIGTNISVLITSTHTNNC